MLALINQSPISSRFVPRFSSTFQRAYSRQDSQCMYSTQRARWIKHKSIAPLHPSPPIACGWFAVWNGCCSFIHTRLIVIWCTNWCDKHIRMLSSICMALRLCSILGFLLSKSANYSNIRKDQLIIYLITHKSVCKESYFFSLPTIESSTANLSNIVQAFHAEN